MSDDNQPLEQRKAGAGTAATPKNQKVKSHFKKWWWVYLLIFIAIVLLITLPIIYVGFPRIAQSGINKANNEVTAVQFFKPTPDSITVSQYAITHNTNRYTPTLDPFSAGVYVVTNGSFAADPTLYLETPSIHATNPTSNNNIVNQTVPIYNHDQVAIYTTQLLLQSKVTTALVGKPRLHIGKLPVITVDYNSTSEYNGMAGLSGFNVTNIKIDPGNTLLILPNMNGTAYIPNRSNITVELGNVTFSLNTTKAGKVGETTIQDMVIRPGDNYLPLQGILNQTLVLASLDNGFVNITTVGTSCVYNGQHIPYYEKALAANVLNLRLNVLQILKDSSGL